MLGFPSTAIQLQLRGSRSLSLSRLWSHHLHLIFTSDIDITRVRSILYHQSILAFFPFLYPWQRWFDSTRKRLSSFRSKIQLYFSEEISNLTKPLLLTYARIRIYRARRLHGKGCSFFTGNKSVSSWAAILEFVRMKMKRRKTLMLAIL